MGGGKRREFAEGPMGAAPRVGVQNWRVWSAYPRTPDGGHHPSCRDLVGGFDAKDITVCADSHRYAHLVARQRIIWTFSVSRSANRRVQIQSKPS